MLAGQEGIALMYEPGEMVERLGRLQATSVPQWGVMTAGEMVVHCADQMRVCRGEKQVTSMSVPRLLRPLVKWIFVTRKKEFRPGMKTIKELDSRAEMTRPTSFEADRGSLVELVEDGREIGVVDHPLFGTLNGQEARELSLRHLDYHLRQFGV